MQGYHVPYAVAQRPGTSTINQSVYCTHSLIHSHAFKICLLLCSIRVRMGSSEFRVGQLKLWRGILWPFNGFGEASLEKADCATSVGQAVKWDRRGSQPAQDSGRKGVGRGVQGMEHTVEYSEKVYRWGQSSLNVWIISFRITLLHWNQTYFNIPHTVLTLSTSSVFLHKWMYIVHSQCHCPCL